MAPYEVLMMRWWLLIYYQCVWNFCGVSFFYACWKVVTWGGLSFGLSSEQTEMSYYSITFCLICLSLFWAVYKILDFIWLEQINSWHQGQKSVDLNTLNPLSTKPVHRTTPLIFPRPFVLKMQVCKERNTENVILKLHSLCILFCVGGGGW